MSLVALSPNGVDEYCLNGFPDELLVATMDGVIALRRDRTGWTVAKRELPGLHVSSLLLSPTSDVHYAGTHGSGIFRRTGASNWTPSSDGLTSANVFSLNYRFIDGKLDVFTGTEPAYVFHRLDGDATWHEFLAVRDIPSRDTWSFPAEPHIAHAKHVDFDSRYPRRFYVSIEQGALLRTDDDGATFEELTFWDSSYVYPTDVHRVAMNPLNRDEMYLTGGDGVTRSQDGGRTWRHVANPQMRVGYPDHIFCSPDQDGVLFTSGGGGRPGLWRQSGDANAAVARSCDHGETWEALDLPPLRGNIEAMTLVSWPAGCGFFIGTTDGDVFASNDRGATWEHIGRGLPPVSKSVHYSNVMKGRAAAQVAS